MNAILAIIRKQGIYGMRFKIISSDNKFYPVFLVELLQDKYEFENRGFRAMMNVTAYNQLSSVEFENK